ncbi:Yip1 family protein [Pseudogracilibacillus sp. SE30717A]|uniref:Yip1 family protein n=1 Tax=Pseudogracilibacillus sp. SE30717A TaxID=3098293 RepID=UPI00300E1DD7
MANEMNSEVEETIAEKPSLFGMIMNPKEQFERIRENPKVIVALIIVTLITTVGMLMMANGIDFVNDPSLAGMPEEELMIVAMMSQIGFVIIGVVTPVFGILISAFIHWIISKIVHSEVSFKQLFSMNTYIFMISAISFILNGIVFMLIGGEAEILFTSLNSIIGAKGILGAFLGSIEIFSIWALIITAIGLQVVAKFSKGLSWAVVIAFYIVGLVFQMISAGLNTMLGV